MQKCNRLRKTHIILIYIHEIVIKQSEMHVFCLKRTKMVGLMRDNRYTSSKLVDNNMGGEIRIVWII